MNKEDWAQSGNAPQMLKALHQEQPKFFASQIPQLHRFLIACCWKHKHLIPQHHLRNGLRGAEKWLEGEVTSDELNKLNWYAEAEAFAFDYAKTEDDFNKLRKLIASVPELNGMPFSEAKQLMQNAAYFAECAMIYSNFRDLPWIGRLFTSPFLCADLLRQHIKPSW